MRICGYVPARLNYDAFTQNSHPTEQTNPLVVRRVLLQCFRCIFCSHFHSRESIPKAVRHHMRAAIWINLDVGSVVMFSVHALLIE